jgi:hypothetical protein
MRTVALSVAVGLAVGACAAQRSVIRPGDWPANRSISSCVEISGHYVNRAVATTPWMARNYQAPEPILSQIFYEGPDPSLDSGQTLWLSIQPDLTIWMGNQPAKLRPVPGEGRAELNCLSDALVWTKKDDAFSEHSKEQQQRTLEFSIAKDGSLIVHRTFASKGTGLMMVPFSEANEDWLRFQRAP